MTQTDRYAVIHDGKILCNINRFLAERQKITDDQLAALKMTHVIRHHIFSEAKKTKDGRKLRVLAKLFDALEFEQQKLWNFPQDANFHRWFELPGCSCPKLDNEDRLGTKHRIIVTTCKVHGRTR